MKPLLLLLLKRKKKKKDNRQQQNPNLHLITRSDFKLHALTHSAKLS